MASQKEEPVHVLHGQMSGQLRLLETVSNFNNELEQCVSCLRFDQRWSGQKKGNQRTYQKYARVEKPVFGHESLQFSTLASSSDPELPHDGLGVSFHLGEVLFKFDGLISDRTRFNWRQKSTYEYWLSLGLIFRSVGTGSESQATAIYAVKVLLLSATVNCNHAAQGAAAIAARARLLPCCESPYSGSHLLRLSPGLLGGQLTGLARLGLLTREETSILEGGLSSILNNFESPAGCFF